MIETEAKVVAVEPGYVWVETERKSACGHCAEAAQCGVSAIGKLVGGGPVRMRVLDPVGAEVDQTLVLGLSEEALVGAAAVSYMVPLLVMIGAVAVSVHFGAGDGIAFMSGVAGLIAGFYAVRWRLKRGLSGPTFQPVILRYRRSGCGMGLTRELTGDSHG